MATITFYALSDTVTFNDLAGSGVGFYDSGGFGTSVRVGNFNGASYVTNSVGTAQGPQIINQRWASTTGVYNQLITPGPTDLRAVPYNKSLLNPRFTHSSAVYVDNVKLYIYDRTTITSPESGANTYVYEVIKPTSEDVNATGLGGTTWTQFLTTASSVTPMTLTYSPGSGGTQAPIASGSRTSGTRHDWYLLLSQTPTSIGSKLGALYLSLEYL